MKTKTFVSVEVAKLLKENGFNDECIAYYCVNKNFEESIIKFIPENYELKISLDGHNEIRTVVNNEFTTSITAPTYFEAIEFLLEKGYLINCNTNKEFVYDDCYFKTIDDALLYVLDELKYVK